MSVDNATGVVAPPAASVNHDTDGGGGFDVSDRRRRRRQPRPFGGSSAAVDAITLDGVQRGEPWPPADNGDDDDYDDGDDGEDDGIAANGDGGTAERTPLLHNRQSSSDGTGLIAEGLTDNPKYGSVGDDVFMSTPPMMTGGFASQPSTGSTGKQQVFCIHGKPSGCCAMLVSTDDKNSNHEKSDQPDGKSPITIFNEHCHPNRETTSAVHKKARRKLIFASALCLFFMIGEAVGGYMSSSLAIATDASHLLTDFASFMISLCALWVASRPATRAMPFGWYRAEVLGALTSVLLIWVVTGVLLYLAVERIKNMTYTIDANIMVITSVVGLCVNVVMGLTLHQHSHSHGGLESHSHENSDPKSANINVRAAYIHVLGDIIQSLGVLIAAIVVYFKPEWKIVDPICTFFFSLLVLVTTFNILRDTMIVLMEGMPKGVNFVDVLETFMSIDGVVKVHNLRVWALSPDKIALAAHLAVNPGVNTTAVLKEASRRMYKKYNFFDCTLQIEEFESQMDNCKQCQPPKC